MQRLLTLLLAVLHFLAPLGHGGARVFHHDSDIGLASDLNGFVCLAIGHPNLLVGQSVSLVVLAPQQSLTQAKVVGPLPNRCPNKEGPDSTGRVFYELRLVKGTLPSGAPAIAVVGSVHPLRKMGDSVVGDLDGSHHLEYFRQCTSSEGVHLSVWAGKPLTGKRLWHEYYYLGYDVEPNCTDKDVADNQP